MLDNPYIIVLILAVAFIVLSAIFLRICFVKSPADEAIVRTGSGGISIFFDRAIVIPSLHTYEFVPLSIQKLSYERTGDRALTFRCGSRVELVVDLMLCLNRYQDHVKTAVTKLGASRLQSPDLLREHFKSMFNDSLESIAGRVVFQNFAADKDEFREEILKHIGTDLSGMAADDICIHHLKKI